MFFSTRNDNLKIRASEAILKGISDDGGLFLPSEIPCININDYLHLDYKEVAFKVLRLYLDDFSDLEISEAINKAYSKDNFNDKIIDTFDLDNFSFLELFHGPTITFKDMALSILPYLLEISKKKNNVIKEIMILTATSGDTGSAALSNFSKTKDINISVLYPEGGVSDVQEKQMLYFTNSKARAYSVRKSNFDDCQTLVKKILVKKQDKYILSSANSINIGRLIPQIVYYIYSYLELVRKGRIKINDSVDYIVPTGNFGNILACYIAKCMGVPIGNIICASNENRVLTDFFSSGVYSLDRKFMKTNSPSMDILISSNLERLLYLVTKNSSEVKKMMIDLKEKGGYVLSEKYLEKLSCFKACSVDQNKTLVGIKECFNKFKYLIDPHTSVAYCCYLEIGSKENYTVVVSTASPFKFPKTIIESLGFVDYDNEKENLIEIAKRTGVAIPNQLKKVLESNIERFSIDREDVEKKIFSNKKIVVRVSATSANFGSGFDCVGVSLKLFNSFSFEKSDVDLLVGFKEEDIKDNLVLKSYKKVFEYLGVDYIPVKISLMENDVPLKRGLGSSSTCIIAGIIGANKLLNDVLSKDEILSLSTTIEGHPDNVSPCLLGGFVASFKNGEEIVCNKYEVNSDLKFIACINNVPLKTSLSRGVLKDSYSLSEVTYNLSRLVNLPLSLKRGDLSLLKEVTKDKIHTPFRLKLIPSGEELFSFCDKENLPVMISGAGSTILIITKDLSVLDKLNKLDLNKDFSFKVLEVNNDTPFVEEE